MQELSECGDPTRTVFSWVARDGLAVEVTFLQSSGDRTYWTLKGKSILGKMGINARICHRNILSGGGREEKMKMSRQLTKQRIPLRQVDLRNGLIQIFLFDRRTEFLALYSGSYGVRPGGVGWKGRAVRAVRLDDGKSRVTGQASETTEFHHSPILPIVHISYLNSKSFAYDPSSWKHSKMRIYVCQLCAVQGAVL